MNKQYIFKKKLLSWSIKNTREYSWRNTKDPWKILLLEVISQQTQLDRANKYYQKFIKKFPNPTKMSKATKKEILEMWSGLGYNKRAIRLHEASKILSKNSFDSIYPNFDILPGVGEYTKNAILSFAYNDKVIPQDTNVLRVFSRFFGTKDPKNLYLKPKNI
jgi:A/G-specific DNA glycosylase